MLSREQMEAVIRSGGSVLHQGRIISRIEALPSAAELAKGDPDKEAQAAQSLQQQIDQLQAQLAELQEPPKPKRSPKKEGEQE
jgi:hypothetical protein